MQIAVVIDQFQYIKIQHKTIDLSTRLWVINAEFVGFIPQSLVLRPIVLRWLKTFSSTFQDVDFDGLLLPLFIN